MTRYRKARERQARGGILSGFGGATPAPKPPPARAALDAVMSEAEFQRQVVELAERLGWAVWHDNDPRRNAAGFPDLLLVRERVVWMEVKRDGEGLRPAQAAFHARLKAAGAEVYVVSPRLWAEAERILRERRWTRRV